MSEVRACSVHEERRIVTECASCERDLCSACWAHDVDGRPACDECVAHLRERSPVVLPATFAAFAGTGVFLAHEWFMRGVLAMDDLEIGLITGWVIVAFAAYFMYRRERYSKLRRVITERADAGSDDEPPPPSGGPYRGAPARRVFERVLPVWSGEMTTLALTASLGLAALAVPLKMDAEPWVETTVIFVSWWAIWFAALFFALYRGRRVADDHGKADVVAPRSKDGKTSKGLPGPKELLTLIVVLPVLTGPQGIVIGIVLVILLFVPLALGAAVAFFVPFVFLGAYLVLGHGIRAALNDAPDCVGNPGHSAARAAVFASTFTVPVATLVAIVWIGMRLV